MRISLRRLARKPLVSIVNHVFLEPKRAVLVHRAPPRGSSCTFAPEVPCLQLLVHEINGHPVTPAQEPPLAAASTSLHNDAGRRRGYCGRLPASWTTLYRSAVNCAQERVRTKTVLSNIRAIVASITPQVQHTRYPMFPQAAVFGGAHAGVLKTTAEGPQSFFSNEPGPELPGAAL